MICTIDVGLKNLAMCVMNCEGSNKDLNNYKIELWNVYNTIEDDEQLCKSIVKKTGQICNKKASMKYKLNTDNEIYCCKTHFPKTIKSSKTNTYKQKMVKDMLLQDIASSVLKCLDNIFIENYDTLKSIDKVFIELQPKVNNKMKLISHIIYGKFVEFYMKLEESKTIVRFVRASQKLRAYKGPIVECKLKGSYAKRKYLSIQYTKWFLENKFCDTQKELWLPFLLNCKKADDISDTFLMAINGLK